MSEEVTVTADPDVAEACRSASSQELRKLDLLVNFSLREATYGTRLLQEVMLEVVIPPPLSLIYHSYSPQSARTPGRASSLPKSSCHPSRRVNRFVFDTNTIVLGRPKFDRFISHEERTMFLRALIRK